MITDQPFQSLTATASQGGDNGVTEFAIDNGAIGVAAEPVPFEAEGAMGVVALASYFGYRYFKKRQRDSAVSKS
ncbi:MAG: hypothetical protein GVY17_01075 [Cyanobacteria bacterium]|nr:hypothetical protein [Cyanobacteria bacterium GSL.Bin21]